MPERCEWCGETHDQGALCLARPRWSRRGFLSFALTGAAALVAAPWVSALDCLPVSEMEPLVVTSLSIGEIVAATWGRMVFTGLQDNIFTSQWVRQCRDAELKVRLGRNT